MPQRPSRPAPRSTKRRRSCLSLIALLGVGLLVIVALYALLVRPALSNMIGSQISARLGPTAMAGADAALPGVVSALPTGEVVVEQRQANDFLSEHQDDYGPIDEISVRFVDGEAVADLSALGMSGVARSGLAAVDGKVALVDPQIDGALGLAVSSGDMLTPLLDRLNAELASQGKYVEQIQIENGQIVIVTR
ncbi:MAG: hypothetical protein HGB28_02010 [Oscillochloris sp.]|nr:hypothetical protein [Oscillochloris sp.]